MVNKQLQENKSCYNDHTVAFKVKRSLSVNKDCRIINAFERLSFDVTSIILLSFCLILLVTDTVSILFLNVFDHFRKIYILNLKNIGYNYKANIGIICLY